MFHFIVVSVQSLFIVNKEKTQYNFVMKVKSFLKYVEIQTKAASMIPFAAGTVLALYLYSVM